MTTMMTSDVCDHIEELFPQLAAYLKNGCLSPDGSPTIGVFQGSDTRSNGQLALGGIECTITRMLPVNIQVQWSESQKQQDKMAIEIYNKLLLHEPNFFVGDVKVATVQLLDGSPISLGRNDKNVCQSTIRANYFYYV